MADEYDGRVVIDTELDNSGFEKGTDKLISAMKGVERTINNIGETASHAFDVDRPIRMPVEPELPEPEELAERIEQVEKELPPVRPHLDSKEYDKTTERLQAKTRRLMAEINRMANTTAQGFKSTSSVIAFNNKLDDTAEKIVQARQELEEFGEQQIPTDQYKETTAAIEKAEKALLKLYDRRDALEELGTKESSKQWQRLQMDIEKAEAEVERYEMAADRMRETGEAFVDPQATAEYQRMAAEIERAQRALEANAALVRSERIEEAQLAVQAAQTALAEAQTNRERKAAMKQLAEAREQLDAVAEASKSATGEPNPSVWQRFADTLRGAAGVVRTEMQGVAAATNEAIGEAMHADASVSIWQRLANVMTATREAAHDAGANIGIAAGAAADRAWDNLGASIKNTASSAAAAVKNLFTLQGAMSALGGVARGAVGGVQLLGKGLLTVGTAAVTTAAKLAKLGAKGVLNGVKKGFDGAASSAKKLMTRLREKSPIDSLTKKLTSFKGMLMSRIKRTFIGFLFEQIKQSFNELAKFDARFDKSISNLRNRTSELGANVMAAFGGLIRQIEPYITALIEKMSEGVTRINAVLTSLRGEDTMQVAVQRTESYAESLNDAAKSADKARTAQQKLNATLTSIDEIHKLDAPQEDTADAAAEAAENAKTIYENVPVDSILGKMGNFGRQIADRIVQGIKAGDWSSAGQAIADGLNALTDKVSEKLRGVRPAAEQAARNVADLLNGLVKGFDGEGFGQAIADGLNLGFSTANEFLKRFDFHEFGATIGDSITGAVRRFEWNTAGEAIGNGINGAINTARGIIEHTDWRALGHGLATGFNNLITTIDWGNAAQTLSKGVIGLLNTISQTIRDTDWQQLGRNVAEFIKNIDWTGVTKALFEAIGAVLGGLAGFIWGLISGALESVKKWWYDSAYEDGQFSMEGLLAGIKKALKNIGTWIKKSILDPFVNGFKSAFGISSPSKKMKPYGEYVAEGILEGIKDIFSSITSWVKDNILEPFKRGFSTAFSIVGDKANALFESGKAIANGIKGGISAGWNAISTLIKGKKDELKKDSDALADSAVAGFADGEKFQKAGQKVVDGVSAGLSSGDLKDAGSNIMDSLGQGINNSYDAKVGTVVSQRASDIVKGFKEGGYHGAGESVDAGVGAGIREKYFETIGEAVLYARNTAAAGFRNEDNEGRIYYEAGAYAAEMFSAGVRENYATAIQQFEGIAPTEWTTAMLQAFYGVQRAEKSWNDTNIRTVDSLRTIKAVAAEVAAEAEDLNGTEIQVSVEGAASVLDKVADKLAAIARTFEAIGRALPDMTAVPVPAYATGAFAPAATRVTDSGAQSDRVTASLIERLIGRIEELEEAVANRPIRVESKVMLDQREIGRATAEYNTNNGQITNGNGGANAW